MTQQNDMPAIRLEKLPGAAERKHSYKPRFDKPIAADLLKKAPEDEKNAILVLERMNQKLFGAHIEASYSTHDLTKKLIVKLMDKENGKVLKEIPSEKSLDILAKLWENEGLIADLKK
jgi:flagellar protein FlaG